MSNPHEDPRQWIHKSKPFAPPERGPLPQATLDGAREMAAWIVTESFPAHSLFESARSLLADSASFEKNILSEDGDRIHLEISTGDHQTAEDYPGYVWIRTNACDFFTEESIYYGVHSLSGDTGVLVNLTSGAPYVNGYEHDDLKALASGMHKLTTLASQ